MDSHKNRVVRLEVGQSDDDSPFMDESKPFLHPNTYHRNLSTFLHSLNLRRLHTGQNVDILSQHNQSVIAHGLVLEIIPAEEFSGATGQFHDAIVVVKTPDGVKHFNPTRIVPPRSETASRKTPKDTEVGLETGPLHNIRCAD